jgi:ABC-2 type transport system permease protein
MKTMKWLLQREFWEHKGSMFWAPVVVAAIMLASMGGSLLFGSKSHNFNMMINGEHLSGPVVIKGLPTDIANRVVDVATSGYLSVSAPIFLMMAVVIFWYCLGALYDERRDRSILFWKSLPISDEASVLSKVITALCVAPVITMAVATAMSLVFLLLACAVLAFHGVNLFGQVLSSPSLYLSPVAMLSLLPVYFVWALPTIGWLLLVSSWARSKVFLWAVGAPLVALLIIRWVSVLLYGIEDNAGPLFPFARDVVAQGLAGVIPGIWFSYKGVDPTTLVLPGMHGISLSGLVGQSYATLASADAWVGALVGAAMIFAAIRIRRWRDEG